MRFLAEKAKRHDKEAFVELMELYKMDMYKVARGYFQSEEDIADVMQETILSCYEEIAKLRETKYFKTWLIRILINHCNKLYRARQKESLLEEFPDVIDTYSYEQNLEFEELIQALDEKYKLTIILYYGEGFKIKEIAQILDIPESTVKTRLARGRKQLEKMYRMPIVLKEKEG